MFFHPLLWSSTTLHLFCKPKLPMVLLFSLLQSTGFFKYNFFVGTCPTRFINIFNSETCSRKSWVKKENCKLKLISLPQKFSLPSYGLAKHFSIRYVRNEPEKWSLAQSICARVASSSHHLWSRGHKKTEERTRNFQNHHPAITHFATS